MKIIPLSGILSFVKDDQGPSPYRRKRLQKQAFTLVELIVVITILAILGTIAFISLKGYSRDARDATRTADLGNIKTSLELFSLKTGKYPSPDSYSTITYSGGTEKVWYQGNVGDKVTTNLKSLNEKPLDPLTSAPYTYSVTNSYKEYEVLALYEGSVAYNPILNQANAAVTSLTPKIVGNYNGVYVQTTNYIIPTPSIVTSEAGSIILDSNNIKSQVITNGTNIPQNNLTITKTGALKINLSIFTGSITKTSTNTEKINLIKQIQLAYSGINLSNNISLSLLNKNIDLKSVNIINRLSKLSLSQPLGDWRDLDPNCDKPDVVIGNQIWAGCNSTLDTGIEYTSELYCYDYNGINLGSGGACGVGNLGDSNDKESDYYTVHGANTNGDIGVNNIWGKLYTWSKGVGGTNGTSLDNNNNGIISTVEDNEVCPGGYHIPTDTEFEILETTLNGGVNCRNGTNGFLCDGLGWKNRTNNSKTTSNNIVEALQLPLSGCISLDRYTNCVRGMDTSLWTSSFSAGSAFSRNISYYFSTIYRYNAYLNNSFNVRCIKD